MRHRRARGREARRRTAGRGRRGYEITTSYYPPVIRISTAGFQYRGKTIPLRSIEDVARAPRAVCRVVSDARIVEVERDFCEPSEREWLRHEIRRLVIEAGG